MLFQVRGIRLEKRDHRDQNTLRAILHWCLFSATPCQSMQVYQSKTTGASKRIQTLVNPGLYMEMEDLLFRISCFSFQFL